MRNFFKFSLASLFVILVPIVLALAMPRLNGYSTATLKQYWRDHHFYDQISQTAQSQLGGSSADSEASAENQLFTLIKGELTPSYIQTKVETTVDQTRDWTVGKTSTPPSVSFNDLQDKLAQQSPVSKQQLDQALAQLKTAEAQGNQLPQVSSDAQSQQAFQQLLTSSKNLDAIANGNWTFSLAQPLSGLPFAYRIYSIALPTLLIIAILSLIGAILLGTNLASRLVSTGWTLAVAGIWNGFLAGIFYGLFVGPMLLKTIPHSGASGDIVTTVVQSLQQVMFGHFVMIEVVATVLLLAIGLLLLVLGKRQPQPVATASSSTASKTNPMAAALTPGTESIVAVDTAVKK